MDTIQLAKNFIKHSPGFYEDLNKESIDSKHQNIVKKAYDKINNGTAFDEFNFRNWEAQSDMDVPAQFCLSKFISEDSFKYLAKYIYKKTIKRKQNHYFLSSLKDDIEIINNVNAADYLLENPVHLTPGVSNYYSIDNTTVNIRWLRYIYILKRILDLKLIDNDNVWVDIGSYYGGLQGLLLKYKPNLKVVLLDFHHQLCRSYIYLSKLHNDINHIFPDQIKELGGIENAPERSVIYVPATEFNLIKNQDASLVTNYFSFGEMKKETFLEYKNSHLIKTCKNLYSVNRVVSSPFFEKTYDSQLNILDYIEPQSNVTYFDLFPMHYYLLLERKMFGRFELRNVSSPYFELILSNEV